VANSFELKFEFQGLLRYSYRKLIHFFQVVRHRIACRKYPVDRPVAFDIVPLNAFIAIVCHWPVRFQVVGLWIHLFRRV
jgi:hypothetical protein